MAREVWEGSAEEAGWVVSQVPEATVEGAFREATPVPATLFSPLPVCIPAPGFGMTNGETRLMHTTGHSFRQALEVPEALAAGVALEVREVSVDTVVRAGLEGQAREAAYTFPMVL